MNAKKILNSLSPIKFLTPEEESKIKALKELEKKTADLKTKFNDLMFEKKLHNTFWDTYKLVFKEEKKYGYEATIYQANSLPLSKLESIVGEVQECLCCVWIMKPERFKNYATVKVVTKDMDPKYQFTAPQIEPNQMWLGINFSFEHIIINMYKHHMYLFAGATGSGKTTFLTMQLLSWILGCSPSEIQIWLADISKNEFIHFRQVSHIKYYSYELEQLYEMMMLVKEEIYRRKEVMSKFREKGKSTGIEEYNNLMKKQNKPIMPINIVMIDELSELMPDPTDSEEEANMKKACMAVLKKVARMGRNFGIYSVVCTQKTSNQEMPGFLKNQSAVRVSFRANDAASSEVIMGNTSAVGLTTRYAVWSLNGGSDYDYLYSPAIDTPTVSKLIKPHINYNKPKLKYTSKETNQDTQKVRDKRGKRNREQKPKEFKQLPSVEKIDTTIQTESEPQRTTTRPILKGDGIIDR